MVEFWIILKVESIGLAQDVDWVGGLGNEKRGTRNDLQVLDRAPGRMVGAFLRGGRGAPGIPFGHVRFEVLKRLPLKTSWTPGWVKRLLVSIAA